MVRCVIMLVFAMSTWGCDEKPRIIAAGQLGFLRQRQPPLLLRDVLTRLGHTSAYDGGYYRFAFRDGTTIDYWMEEGPDPDTFRPGDTLPPVEVAVVVETRPGQPPKIIWPEALVGRDLHAVMQETRPVQWPELSIYRSTK